MTTPTMPDLELLRKAIQDFRPNPHRVPFNNLMPFHDSIVELRNKNASYVAIADLLQQHGVKTSRARVAEYGRIVVEGGKTRSRKVRYEDALSTDNRQQDMFLLLTEAMAAMASGKKAEIYRKRLEQGMEWDKQAKRWKWKE